MNTQLRSRDHRRRLVVDGVTYLLLDQFTTNAVAPLSSPRTCEPGPGTLTLVQTDGQFSIVSSALNFPAQATPALGDQGLYGTALSRVTGRTLLTALVESTLGGGFPMAWSRAASISFTAFANVAHSFYIPSGTGQVDAAQNVGNGAANVGTIAGSTSYQLALPLRGTGSFFLIKGGAFTEWTLLWVGNADSTATVYPASSNALAAGTLDDFRVTDLPSPWTDDYGIATQRLAGSVAQGTTYVHEGDAIIEATVTTRPSAGQIELRFRMQDTSNYWQVTVDSTGALDLDEVVATVVTQRGTAAGVIANGDRIVIVAAGTTIRVYEANTLRITYASASNFQTETDGELETLGTAGVLSDLISWPRVLSGTALSTLSAV